VGSSCTAGVVTACQTGAPTGTDQDCDAVDQDCDGTADDGYVSDETCFLPGVCAAGNAGSTCTTGVVTACQTGAPTGTDQDCDAVDQDCDGTADDGYVSDATCFLPGVCAAGNVGSTCTAGVVTACQTGTPTGTDQDCDAVDQDCDGTADDGYVSDATCFLPGVCAAGNVGSTCTAGVVTACQTGSPTGTDADCDAVDQDCDGTADDGYVPVPTTCGPPACPQTGMTSCVAGQIQDSCIPVGATLSLPGGVMTTPGQTIGVAVQASDLSGLGVVSGDLDIVFNPAVLQPQSVAAGTLTGACTTNGNTAIPGHVLISVFCTAPLSGTGTFAEVTFQVVGNWGATTPLDFASVLLNEGDPAACHDAGDLAVCGSEVCDGFDNDCNGQTDEFDPQIGQACSTGLPGVCTPGTVICATGALACQGLVGPSPESCNDIDDDCDGSIDDGFGQTTCGVGACQVTVDNCSGGVTQVCVPGTPIGPTDPTCDAVDDDCDGTVDEDYLSVPTQCGDPLCSQSGATSCVGGVVQDSCVAPSAAISVPAMVTAIPGQTFVVPINVSDLTGLGVVSADITLTYNAAVLHPLAVGNGTVSAGCSGTGNLAISGRVLYGFFCTSALNGAGSIAEVTFEVLGGYGSMSPLGLASAVLNEGNPTACAVGGDFSVCGPGITLGTPCVRMPGSCAPPGHLVCASDGASAVCVNDPLLQVEYDTPTTARIKWQPIPGAGVYDVVRGNLRTLTGTGGDYSIATQMCLSNNNPMTFEYDPEVPAPSQGFWYLMRADLCTGGSTYEEGSVSQVGLRDPGIALSGLACP